MTWQLKQISKSDGKAVRENFAPRLNFKIKCAYKYQSKLLNNNI